MPNKRNLSGIIPKCATPAFLIVISLLVMAASPMNEPISIMSGKMRCDAAPNLFTPSMRNKLLPMPVIFAPILFNSKQSCCT